MGQLDYKKAEILAKSYKIRCIDSRYVDSCAEAKEFAGKERIVIKAIPSRPIHKSKSGLVAVDIDAYGLEAAYDSVLKAASKYRPYKVLVQKMVKNGIEIIIGGKIDKQFGKMVLIGLGGIYVEAFKDFSLRVCPISKKDAIEMVTDLRSAKVVAKDEQELNTIADLLIKVSRMYYESELSELDLNPVILHDGTYDAVDLRMIQ